MVLNFEAGKFYLNIGENKKPKLENEKWNIQTEKIFSTDHLGEAVRFRRFACINTQKLFQRVLARKFDVPPIAFPKVLDSHQRDGINWILSRSRSYLAHAPGAGKTAQAILAACYAPVLFGRSLFIVPPSLVENWKREIIKWEAFTPEEFRQISTITANTKLPDFAADFVICADTLITRPAVLAKLTSIRWALVAVDEASRFKEPTSQRTIALFGGNGHKFQSSGIVQNARYAVLLDGSPMPNRPMELWAPTYAMDPAAIDFMDQTEFGFRYCGARQNHFGQWEFKYACREEELKQKLQKSFMHVVKEEDLKHAARLRTLIYLKDGRDKETRKWDEKLLKTKFAISEDASRGELAQLRALIGMSKAPLASEYTKEKLEKGESILLFCWHRAVANALFRALKKYRPGLIIGGTPNERREQIFESFQSGKRKLIIGNIASIGRGHNLQRANRIIFAEFSWTDELNRQCEKRASRKGRDTRLAVRCDYLVYGCSVDELVLKSLFRKQKSVQKVIG